MGGERVILVTGCSSGIGRATALEAAARGHRVFATARNPADLADLERTPGLSGLRLDVTDGESISAALAQVRSLAGRLDALVNNAGYAQYGAIEEIPLDDWRAQFEANLFGTIAVTGAALPLMRASGGGTIVMVSSVGGRLVVPFAAPYCASKHALEALADALRVEVSSFGIRTVVVEPGPIESRFDERARDRVAPLLSRPGPYRDLYVGAERAMNGDFQRGKRPAAVVARVILGAIESPRPRARYRVTPMAKTLIPLARLLPSRWIDGLMRRSLRIPRPR
ncbi:MAG TPA: SDR family oxidoreductase [Thermoanaerobaculia bacterium]|jgi:NAD(P)-dependent dehydrogenase (short-subunit alcohol dehydrogenase family)